MVGNYLIWWDFEYAENDIINNVIHLKSYIRATTVIPRYTKLLN